MGLGAAGLGPDGLTSSLSILMRGSFSGFRLCLSIGNSRAMAVGRSD